MNSFKKNIYSTVTEDSCVDCIAHDVTIGLQTWTACNADVSTYRDGTVIPEVTDPTAWAGLTTGAWCWYNNDPTNGTTYGKLYNWFAVNDSLHGGLAPVGYHVPSDSEWTILSDTLGGASVAGGKMKEAGLCNWASPNTGATNSSGFNGVPSGQRFINGVDANINLIVFYWSTTEGSIPSYARTRNLYKSTGALTAGEDDKNAGYSVRFVKDCPTCIDEVVTIGTQTWTICNADVIEYTDTTPIPEVTDPTAWAALTTGAWCHINNNPANDAIYGKLYNWYAVAGIYDAASLANPALRKQFAPAGYHVPTSLEMTTLVNYLGGNTVAGRKMKEIGTTHWAATNDATNTSCFTALGSGYRFYVTGAYVLFNQYTYWWSSTDITTDGAGTFYVRNDVPNCEVTGAVDKNYGFSVRLIQD